jgi:putative thioredoxin
MVGMLSGVYVTATWCQPCKTFKPIAERVFREMGYNLNFIDVDDPDVEVYLGGVKSVPTIVIFKQGEIVDRIVGAFPEPRLRERLDRLVA